MTSRIYYFSATGNSLAVAKQIADDIGADIVSIARLNPAQRIPVEHDRIGIIFPAYLSAVLGLPLIVERFIRCLDGLQGTEIFAVCTCGGYEFANALAPLEKLAKLIHDCGGALSARYSVRLPMNNLDYKHIPIPISRDIPKIIERAKRKTAQISSCILRGKGTRFALPKMIARSFITMIYSAFRIQVLTVVRQIAQESEGEFLDAAYYLPLTDRSIQVSESCVGCGICARVCPAQNIVYRNGKPEFQHRCEACFACDEWCPHGAIQHWSRSKGIKYHYPTIQLSDLLSSAEHK